MVKLLGIAWTRIRTNMRDPLIRRNVAFFMGGVADRVIGGDGDG